MILRTVLSLYSPRLPFYFVYMLQQVEYDPQKFNSWVKRLLVNKQPVTSVMKRQKLVMTKRAILLVGSSYIFSVMFAVGYVWLVKPYFSWVLVTAIALLSLPQIMRYFLFILTSIAHILIVKPQQRKQLDAATRIFSEHKGVKIAVLGSYGKTTMKELLGTVLSEGLDVAITPGNMNVSLSHARFARKLTGNEDVLVVEFGEGEPGDIERMCKMLQPNYAIITGLAPNHLDHYPDLGAVAADLLKVYEYLDSDNIFVSGESQMLKTYLPKTAQKFSEEGALGWKVSSIKSSIDGISFSLKKAKKHIKVQSKLLGTYQVAPLALVAVLSEKLGLSIKDLEVGLQKTKPFDHRMQPRLVQGAWLIDDAYNGNLEGMQAGLKLMSELKAKRKWYITPGLVDQGAETERVHQELGKVIAKASPDIVVLMDNTAKPIIEKAMRKHGFSGDLRVESDPLSFYNNLEHIVAVGDLVLMQNDWTDNYN